MTIITSKIRELQDKKLNRDSWNISWNLCCFLSNLIKINNPKYLLEIGTSNGFSTLCMLKYLDTNSKIVTIEINKERFLESKQNFNNIKSKNVIQYNLNIFDFLNNNSKEYLKNKFDFIFLDAAQSFYLEIIQLLIKKKLINKKTTIICDNIISHKNMENFIDFMKLNFKVEIINIDSGFLIAKSK